MSFFPGMSRGTPVSPHTQPTPYWSVLNTDKIVVFGDSITTPTYEFFGPWRDYSVSHYKTKGVTPPTFINSGLNGDTISNGKTVVASRVTAYAPTAVVLAFGANDALAVTNPANTAAAVVQYIADYHTAIDLIIAQNPGAKLAVSGVMTYGTSRPKGTNTRDVQFDGFSAGAKQVALDYGIPFIDGREWFFRAGVTETDIFVDNPGLHPNPKGELCWSTLLINALPVVP